MRHTYPEAYFNFIDTTALSDSSASSAAAKSFARLSLLEKESEPQAPYGTMELNQFVLDGSREIFPAEQPEDVPYWSEEKSDEAGAYVINPVLEIVFTKTHSSTGLTLHFAEDIPAEIKITWYTLYGTKLTAAVFNPDSRDYFAGTRCRIMGVLQWSL